MLSVRSRLAAAAGVATISFTAILVRLAETAPVSVALYRAAYALPFLFLLWWRGRKRDHRPLRSRSIAFGSGLFLALDLTFFHMAIDRIGAGLATVLVGTQVVFVAAVAWLVHRERPTKAGFLLVPVIFGGVVLLSGLGRSDAYGADPWGGVLFGLLGGVFYALFLLTLRASNRDHLAPTMGPILDSTLGMGAGAALIGLGTTADLPLAQTAGTHSWLLLLAVVSQVVGWPLINAALPRLAALETSAIVLAQPMLTVLWAALIFAEDFSILQWIGVAMVLGGLVALNLRGAVEQPRPMARSSESPAGG